MSGIVVVAHLRAKPGHGAELLATLAELADRVLRTEPDTLTYAFFVEPGPEPLRVTVIEKYPSRAALAAHGAGVLAEFQPVLGELFDGAPIVHELRPADLAVTTDEPARLTI